MKLSKYGQKIYDVIQASQGHMTAEELHRSLREQGERIGIATVYRNLNQLYDMGKINRVRHPEFGYIYDKNSADHYHFYDTTTHEIYDVDMAYMEELDQLVAKIMGANVKGHSIIFEGNLADQARETKPSED